MSERSTYTYTVRVEHNTFGGAHFVVARLYRDGRKVDSRTFDGTFLRGLAERRSERLVTRWQSIYGAVPA